MKMTESQIFGNINTIEQELLYLILMELRAKKPSQEAVSSDFLQVVDTIHPIEKVESTTVTANNDEIKPPRKRGTPRKKKPTK